MDNLQNINYTDKILRWILDLKPGERHPVSELTNEPAKFIEAVKNLFDNNLIKISEYEFNKDYTTIRRLNELKRKH